MAQAAQNLKASALAQLGNPEPNDIIWELSDESYYLDATREWTFSQQAMQVVDDRVVVETVLDQPLGGVSCQLYCGDEILRLRTAAGQALRPSAARGVDAAAAAGGAFGLRRNLHQKNVAGAGHHLPRDPGILPLAPGPDVLRGLPGPPAGQVRAYRQGAAGRGLHELERPRLLLQIRPVAKCEPIGERARYRGERKPGETPEFKDWREWEGEVASGHFYTEDLEQVRGSSWPRGTARRWSCEA